MLHRTIDPPDLPPQRIMRRAFARKDSRFDGVFFVAVKTTGIFCRPTCRARPPKPANVEFFPTAADAMARGFRPCKLCNPQDGATPPPVVRRLLDLLEHSNGTPLRERDLRRLGFDPSTVRRQFRTYCQMTFAGYQRAQRMGAALRQVRRGVPLVHARLDAGYESASGFRDAVTRLFGTRVVGARATQVLTSRWIVTPLGAMLAVAADDGICLLDFADRKGLERAVLRLRERYGSSIGSAVIVPGEHPLLDELERELREYFAGERSSFSVPVAPQGTEFEQAAWRYLRNIPCGETRTYAQQARAIGAPRAVRAVGRANGMNYISILIPCHRVIASSGALVGYGGGLARKRWLLDHERRRTLAVPAVLR